ncbi:MAG: 50S ribosomal protein L25 [Cellvibrio sp.]
MSIVLVAESRNDLGKGASRRLRRTADLVPGIVYGGAEAPAAFSISHSELDKVIDKPEFFDGNITLNLDGKDQAVKVQAVQRHPSKPKVLHLDLVRA